jgi:catechol 2,3-dioxygenase-like lactoylglutathione lyase family enzyme
LSTKPHFEIQGWNHTAFMSGDMARTVEFYNGKLGLPLVTKVEYPGSTQQHFFFDAGNGQRLGFMWDETAGPPDPWSYRIAPDGWVAHIHFAIDPAKAREYSETLTAKGIDHRVEVRYVPGTESEKALEAASRTMTLDDVNDDAYAVLLCFEDPDGFTVAFEGRFPAAEKRIPNDLKPRSRKATAAV